MTRPSSTDAGRDGGVNIPRIRGADPQPGAWSTLAGREVQIYDARKSLDTTDAWPGEITAVDENGMTVAALGGHLAIQRVRPGGGKKMAAAAFAQEAGLQPGARLGGGS